MRSTVAIVLAVACALVLSAPWTGAAKMLSGDIKKELQTATFHASELAQRGNSVAASKLHLQHVINCLVGDTGSNFKLDAGYPCQGQGNGIIPDLKAAAAMNSPGASATRSSRAMWSTRRETARPNPSLHDARRVQFGVEERRLLQG